MTMPNERRWAVENTGRLLVDLLNPKQTPRVPSDIRKEASRCLRHYPLKYHMEIAAEESPEVFGDWDSEWRGPLERCRELEGEIADLKKYIAELEEAVQ